MMWSFQQPLTLTFTFSGSYPHAPLTRLLSLPIPLRVPHTLTPRPCLAAPSASSLATPPYPPVGIILSPTVLP